MNASDSISHIDDEQCGKLAWVMAALADDDSDFAEGGRSVALSLHLAQCPICRLAADRIEAVTDALGRIDSGKVDDDLCTRALSRTRAALLTGASSTGRTTLEHNDDLIATCLVPRGLFPTGGMFRVGMAIAACLGVAILLSQRMSSSSRQTRGVEQLTTNQLMVTGPADGSNGTNSLWTALESGTNSPDEEAADTPPNVEPVDARLALTPDIEKITTPRHPPHRFHNPGIFSGYQPAIFGESYLDNSPCAVSTTDLTKDRQ